MCFVKLKLLLLAIEEKGSGEGEEGKESKIWINPRHVFLDFLKLFIFNPRDFKIAPNTVGFFIAQSADEVKRLANSARIQEEFEGGRNC